MIKSNKAIVILALVFQVTTGVVAQEQQWLIGEDFLYTSYNAKVGVQTDDPQHELDVNGTVNATSWEVNGETIQGNWQKDGDRLFITEGKLGIGTTNPTEKLTVAGKIHATDIEVEPTVAVPDYVFESSYSLPTLEEMSGYIEEHGHLPHFKSAEEMEREGIDLEETQMALLRTLEEAFLHQVALQERMEQLVKERKQLTEELEELVK